MDGAGLPPKSPQDKKLHILTWGCQMNEYDSSRMADLLAPLGYGMCKTPEEADLVILNTCHIREKAAEKIFSELGRLHVTQKNRVAGGEKMMIAVAGCVAQAEGKEIRKRAPYVDLVFGPQTYHRLPEMIAKATRDTGGVVNTAFPSESKFDFLPEERIGTGVSAFLSVQEGCDKFCTFCVVPYTRGAESSRHAAPIIAEAKRLVAQGAREITLLGQNVNAWHGEGLDGKTWDLGRLLYAMAEIPDLLRLRYTTSHPRDMNESLLNAHRDLRQVMPFIHLPVQSGSSRILTAMNRGHAREEYFDLIDRIRAARPDVAFSSDFIIGFPGETDKDFEDTLDMIARVNFAQAYSFKYSARPGTPAAVMKNHVPEDVKTARLHKAQELLFSQQRAFNESLIGKTIPVLFERARSGVGLHGRTPYMQAVHLAEGAAPGAITNITITRAGLNSLEGAVCN